MKKHMIASAAVAALASTCATLATAQSTVTIYGLVDAGLVRDSGGINGTLMKVGSGTVNYSRLGFRGTEDLGNGLAAIFTLEAGYRIDTGEQDVAGSMFNRQAFAGLKSATYGTLTLGRQYTPYYLTLSTVADPFGTGYAGAIKNLFPTVGNSTRASNTILYATPTYRGISAEIAYSLGEQAGSNKAGRQLGGALAYQDGPLNLRLGYLNRNTDVAPAVGVTPVSRGIGTNTVLAGNYDFKVVKLYLAYQADKGIGVDALQNSSNPFGSTVAPTPSNDARDALLGVQVPLVGGTLMASYINKNDRTALNQDAHQWGIGYTYPVSKRTNLYTAYAKINNKNGAGYTVGNNTDAGTGDTGFNLGIRHTF